MWRMCLKLIQTGRLRFFLPIKAHLRSDANVPPFGTPDADLLHYLELSQRLLVTDNRESMPEHLREHWAEGGHIWGLFWVHPHLSTGRLAQELVMVWETSEAEEWMEITDWIPF